MFYNDKEKCKPVYDCDCKKPCKKDCCKCDDLKIMSHKKYEEAIYLTSRANEIERKAMQLEEQAKKLICDARELWEEYEEISEYAMKLMCEAQDDLNKAVECYKNCNGDHQSIFAKCPINCNSCYEDKCKKDCKKDCNCGCKY